MFIAQDRIRLSQNKQILLNKPDKETKQSERPHAQEEEELAPQELMVIEQDDGPQARVAPCLPQLEKVCPKQ